jgi:HPt (histidine-containing phosphotransfer) domain-containing protein
MSSSPPAPRTLDAVALARLRELDPDGRHGVVDRVLRAFESSLSRMLVQLTAEREDGRSDVVAVIAHTLKASAASVGALELAKACAEVEHRLRSETHATISADVERLLLEGEAALAAVAAMLRP